MKKFVIPIVLVSIFFLSGCSNREGYIKQEVTAPSSISDAQKIEELRRKNEEQQKHIEELQRLNDEQTKEEEEKVANEKKQNEAEAQDKKSQENHKQDCDNVHMLYISLPNQPNNASRLGPASNIVALYKLEKDFIDKNEDENRVRNDFKVVEPAYNKYKEAKKLCPEFNEF